MKKDCKRIKLICCSIIILIYAGIANIVNAEEIETAELPYTEAYIRWMELPEEERKNAIQPRMFVKDILCEETVSVAALRLKSASKYDLRNSITIKLKNQMDTGSCWAMAGSTALETNMAKTKNKNVEYSPRHIEYATARNFTDGTNNVMFDRAVDDGGNTIIFAGYLTSGIGPIQESEMPFKNSTKPISLSEIKNKSVNTMLKEYVTFPSISKKITNGKITYSNGGSEKNYKEYDYAQVLQIREKMKDHITKYGSLITQMPFYKEFFSNDSKSFNCNVSDILPNHAVSIIGWDDDYAVTNFKSKYQPLKPGAWLIQNSHGNSNSYFYISYEDVWVEQDAMGIIELDDTDYDSIYQYNYAVPNRTLNINADTTYAVNIFKKDESTEFLNEITFFTATNEQFEIFVNPYDGTTDQNKFIKIKTVDKTDSDYVTVEPDYPIALSEKEFAVMIKYINESGKTSIPVEAKSDSEQEREYKYRTSSEGESFYYINNQFVDMKKMLIDSNACIKAYSKKNIPNPKSYLLCNKYKLLDNGYMISDVPPDTTLDDFEDVILLNSNYKVTDENNNNVTSGEKLISTGMRVETEFDEKYSIIVKGDTNGDGKVTGTDLLRTKWHVLEMENLTGEYLIASDINGDGKTTPTDALNIKQYVCELIDFNAN